MEYEKCLVELDVVLNRLSESVLKKIPEDVLNGIQEKKDKEYTWEYDENKELKEQQLNRKTIIMLSYLNMEYLLNNEQKEFMKIIHEQNEQKLEKEKHKKYNTENLFSNTKENSTQRSTDFSMIEVKEDFWYYKLFKFLKNIFRSK